MKRTTLVLTAAMLVALLALAACGGGDDPTPSPNASGTPVPFRTLAPGETATSRPTRTGVATPVGAVPQPCSLVNLADVQLLIGSITSTQPGTGECVHTGDTGVLTVHLEPKAETEAAATQKLTEIAGTTGEVAAVEDAGFYVSDSEIAGRKGLYVFTLTSTKPGREVLLTLAQTAAANLPTS
jgi:hypothetical protein